MFIIAKRKQENEQKLMKIVAQKELVEIGIEGEGMQVIF